MKDRVLASVRRRGRRLPDPAPRTGSTPPSVPHAEYPLDPNEEEELSPGFGDVEWEEEEKEADEWGDEAAETDWLED